MRLSLACLLLAAFPATAQPGSQPALTQDELRACVALERRLAAAETDIAAATAALEAAMAEVAEARLVIATLRDTARVDSRTAADLARAEVVRDLAQERSKAAIAGIKTAEVARIAARDSFALSCKGRRYVPAERDAILNEE